MVCSTLAQDKEIDNAKMQMQGQLAAQYIQDVMQARARGCAHAHGRRTPRTFLVTARARPPAQKITDKCFTRCVVKPNPRLDDSEKMCTAKCMDRYLDAMAIVSQAWAARAKQQAQMQGGGGGMGGFE